MGARVPYRVWVKEVWTYPVYVDAVTKEGALEEAREELSSRSSDYALRNEEIFEYSHTLDSHEWTVEEVN